MQGVVQINKPGKKMVKVGLNSYLDISVVAKTPLSWFDNQVVFSAGAYV